MNTIGYIIFGMSIATLVLLVFGVDFEGTRRARKRRAMMPMVMTQITVQPDAARHFKDHLDAHGPFVIVISQDTPREERMEIIEVDGSVLYGVPVMKRTKR